MFNFEVLINGRPVKRYYDRSGQIWIEGKKSTNFTLKVKNNSHERILGIVSVDGLNVIDGKHVPIEDSRGYIINSYSSISIPGWKINENEVREFYFTINGNDSYVRKIGADERNIGVMAAAVYKEKIYPITYTYSSTSTSNEWNGTPINVFYNTPVNLSGSVSDITSCAEVYTSMSINPESGHIGTISPKNNLRAVDNSISVGSGERVEFRTNTVDFERGKYEGEVLIYYDTWEGLKRRGILREDEEYRHRPQPFGSGPYCPDI